MKHISNFIEKGVRLFTMPTNEWKKIKIASNENDTTIYIYTDREENERNVINA